jgi:hypothetical protein
MHFKPSARIHKVLVQVIDLEKITLLVTHSLEKCSCCRLPKVKRKLDDLFRKRSKPLYSMTGEDLYTSEALPLSHKVRFFRCTYFTHASTNKDNSLNSLKNGYDYRM